MIIKRIKFINDKEKIVKLIESSEENIQIWNFHSGKLIKKIKSNYLETKNYNF